MAGTIESEFTSMRYTVILQQEPDGGYVATVPALPGCVSQGETRDEVMNNIGAAADFYVEGCIASGDPVPTEAGREYFELKTGNPVVMLPTDVPAKSCAQILRHISA